MEFDPPAGGWTFDWPLWLLIPLALMWMYFAWREPKDGKEHHDGWFVAPAVMTVAAFVGAWWLSL
jgi:hypothetical protein